MKRDEMAHDGEKNRFRYQCERMIEQFTITNPRRLLFAIHFPLPYKTTCERVNILRGNFEKCTGIERGRAGHYAGNCLSDQGACGRVGKL